MAFRVGALGFSSTPLHPAMSHNVLKYALDQVMNVFSLNIFGPGMEMDEQRACKHNVRMLCSSFHCLFNVSLASPLETTHAVYEHRHSFKIYPYEVAQKVGKFTPYMSCLDLLFALCIRSTARRLQNESQIPSTTVPRCASRFGKLSRQRECWTGIIFTWVLPH